MAQNKKNNGYIKLYDQNGVIYPKNEPSKRWFIQYRENGSRKKEYELNKFDTSEERYKFAKKRMRELAAKLQNEPMELPLPNEQLPMEQPQLEQPQLIEQIQQAGNVSLVNLLDQMLVLKKALVRRRTYYSYDSSVRLFVTFIQENYPDVCTDANKLSLKIVIAYRDKLLSERKSPKTTNNYLAFVRTLMNDAIERGIITNNPFKGLKKLRELKTSANRGFSDEQIKRLLPLIEEDRDLNIAVKLMFFCFIRPNEITKLKVENFDFKRRIITIDANISKNGISAHVIMPPALSVELRQIFKKEQLIGSMFVVGDGFQPLSRNTLTVRHKKICNKFRLPKDYTFYSWKHTGVVKAYQNGIDIKSLQMQCRHHSLQMTDVYLKTLGLKIGTAFDNHIIR